MIDFTMILEKIWAFILAILTMLGIITGPDPEPTPMQTLVMSISAMDNVRTVQGACTDGTYVYLTIMDPDSPVPVPARIHKIDPAAWTIVATSGECSMDHANDMTWNSLKNELLICNNNPNYRRVTVVDPVTLTVQGTLELPEGVYSIVYVGDKDCYYAGVSGGYEIVELDSSFRETGRFQGQTNTFTRQGIASDGEFLYCLYHEENCIWKYDFEGNYLGSFSLPIQENEPESIFFLNGVMYVCYNVPGKGNGGMIYKIENQKFE